MLRLVAEGLTNEDIAERLIVSPHTVHRHVANIRMKLGLSSRAAAAAFATREHLISAASGPFGPFLQMACPGEEKAAARP